MVGTHVCLRSSRSFCENMVVSVLGSSRWTATEKRRQKAGSRMPAMTECELKKIRDYGKS